MNMKSRQNGTSASRNKAVDPSTEPPVGAALDITDKHLTLTLPASAYNRPIRPSTMISTPIEWYPSLVRATPEQRANWRWWGDGSAIHWPDIDEHLGIAAMLRGNSSCEYTRQRRVAHAEI